MVISKSNVIAVSMICTASIIFSVAVYCTSNKVGSGTVSRDKKVLTYQPTPDKVAPKSCIKITKGMKTVKGTPCRPKMGDAAISMWYDLETKLFHEWGRDGSYKVYPNPRLRRGR